MDLFEGQCSNVPFSRRGTGDNISLEPACKKAFSINYQPQLNNGVKVLAGGWSQLVDLEAGRAFMKWMASGAGNIYVDKPKTTDVKL